MRIETITFGAYLLAFGGGIISFLSPCVLPIVPGYLSVVTGLDITDTKSNDRQKLWGIARDTGIFASGFTVVFVLLGLISRGVGRFFLRNQVTLTRFSGFVILMLALFMIGSLVLKAPWLYQEKRFHPQLGRFGRFAPLVAGLGFALQRGRAWRLPPSGRHFFRRRGQAGGPLCGRALAAAGARARLGRARHGRAARSVAATRTAL